MLDGEIRAIPIVDGPHILGIVSRRDLLRTLVRSDETIAADINARLEGEPGVPVDCAVSVTDGIVTIVGTFEMRSERELVDALARTVPGVQRVHLKRRH
jgi:osmotically-inducible protein OsmY